MAQYELTVSGYFEAALRIEGGSSQDKELHGRRFEVEVTFTGEKLNPLGMLADERILRAALSQVLSAFDHCYLNGLPEFADANPTAENVAESIYEKMTAVAAESELSIVQVSVRLHPDARVSYKP